MPYHAMPCHTILYHIVQYSQHSIDIQSLLASRDPAGREEVQPVVASQLDRYNKIYIYFSLWYSTVLITYIHTYIQYIPASDPNPQNLKSLGMHPKPPSTIVQLVLAIEAQMPSSLKAPTSQPTNLHQPYVPNFLLDDWTTGLEINPRALLTRTRPLTLLDLDPGPFTILPRERAYKLHHYQYPAMPILISVKCHILLLKIYSVYESAIQYCIHPRPTWLQLSQGHNRPHHTTQATTMPQWVTDEEFKIKKTERPEGENTTCNLIDHHLHTKSFINSLILGPSQQCISLA